MRRLLLIVVAALAMSLLVAAPARADYHPTELCRNVYSPGGQYRMGFCVSEHFAGDKVWPHVRTHTYKLVNGAWADMVADSQTVNTWWVENINEFSVSSAGSSVGGKVSYTHHGNGYLVLPCGGYAIAVVQKVSMRTDAGVPYIWTYSAPYAYGHGGRRPC